MGTRSAGGDDVQAVALQAVADGKVAGRDVRDHGGDEQRAHSLGALFVQHHRFMLEDAHAADAGAEHASETICVLFFHLYASLRHRLIGGQDRVLHKGAEAARFLLGKTQLKRIVTGDGTHNVHAQALTFAIGKQAQAAFAGNHLFPKRIRADAGRRNRAHAGDNHTLEAVGRCVIAHRDIPPSIARTCPVM